MGLFDSIFNGDKKEKIFTVKDFRILAGHTNSVEYCSFSPDSKKIASASCDKTIKIWDIETGNLLKTLNGHNDTVNSCCFSPDGEKLASASFDKTIRIWNVNSGNLLKTIGYSDVVNYCCFSPDGNTIASAMNDCRIIIWDVHTGKPLKTINGGNSSFNRCLCSYSSDGMNILYIGKERAFLRIDQNAVIWNVNAEKVSMTLEGYGVEYCCYSPDNQTIGMLDLSSNRLSILDAKSGKQILVIMKNVEKLAQFCNFSSNSKFILSAFYDIAVIWSASNGMRLLEIPVNNRITYSCFSPSGKFIATSSADGKVKIWNMGGLFTLFTSSAASTSLEKSTAATPMGTDEIIKNPEKIKQNFLDNGIKVVFKMSCPSCGAISYVQQRPDVTCKKCGNVGRVIPINVDEIT
jgi:WD40 repeat protein